MGSRRHLLGCPFKPPSEGHSPVSSDPDSTLRDSLCIGNAGYFSSSLVYHVWLLYRIIRTCSGFVNSFFAQEGEFGLGAHHGDEDQRKAHEHEGGGPLIGEEDGEEHAEGGLQGEEHGGGGGGGVLLTDVLEQEGTAGGADDQVRQAHDQAAVKYAGRQRRAGDQYPQPGKEGEGGKLEGGEDEDVPSLGVPGHGHDVGGEEEAADEGEHIAHVEGGGVVPR